MAERPFFWYVVPVAAIIALVAGCVLDGNRLYSML